MMMVESESVTNITFSFATEIDKLKQADCRYTLILRHNVDIITTF